MAKALKAIIENGYQILQSPNGERINRIIETHIIQGIEKADATCQFSVIVNYNDSPIYDPMYKTLSTHLGELLPVEILGFSPIGTDEPTEKVFAKCAIEFPYETNHRLTAQPVTEYA